MASVHQMAEKRLMDAAPTAPEKKEKIDMLANLGPLAPLVGIWEGDKGTDIAPSDDRGKEVNKYHERVKFEMILPTENHEQLLHGLRYAKTATRIGDKDPFHEELGYWLWDAARKEVYICFMVPRGVSVIAGATVEPTAKKFRAKAELGSPTFGICSNPFLDKEFKTVRAELEISINPDGTLTYDQDTMLEMPGRKTLFKHKDGNVLRKVADA
jgi:hypothetical protein